MPGFEDIQVSTYLLILGIVLLAALVHGALGMGFPMLATPLAAMLTDVLSAMLIVLVPTLAVNIVSIAKGGHWRQSVGRHWPLALYGALGSIVGTRLLVATDPAPYKLLLAAVILGYLYINRYGVRMPWVNRRPALAYLVFGTCGGLLAGTVNVMVPALIIFALEAGLAPRVTVQVFNFCFLLGKLSQALVLARTGLFTSDVILATVPLAAATVAALAVGMILQNRIDGETYRRWMKHVLLVIAVMLVGQYGYGRWMGG
jgi:uncharacterized membrane protein YfcA